MKKAFRVIWFVLLSVGVAVVLFLILVIGEFWYGAYVESPRFWSRSHANKIARALNAYYRDHGLYPEYVLGGYSNLEDDNSQLVVRNPDPLLCGGYLRAYPNYRTPSRQRDIVRNDPRGTGKMKNLVSAPNDPLVRWWRKKALSFARKQEQETHDPPTSEEKEYLNELKCQEHVIETTVRYLMAGGVSHECSYRVGDCQYRIVVPQISGTPIALLSAEKGPGMLWNFGYQRGDFMGGSSQEAALWIYGDHHDPPFVDGPPRGLDLVNTAEGIPEPDGIPDGIIVLYELKDGKVVKVTWADDL